MNTNEAKQIRIEEYLHSLGYDPVRKQGDSLWYKSPFRNEREPSFKVNTERNLWYDFGAGRGGNIIALAQELYASDSLPYLLERIAEQAPGVHPVSFSFGKQALSKPSFQQLEVVPLSSPALYSYLRQRGINTELAKRECREVRYLTEANHTLPSASPTVREATRYATSFSKGASHRRTSPTYGRNRRGSPAASSRASWTTSPSSPCGWKGVPTVPTLTGRTTSC